jgi:disulfide bond formation protein DsbB
VEVGYLGVLPLLLALLALLGRRERRRGLLALLAAFSLLAALGGYTILHGWLYRLVPGLSGMRAPARFVFVTDFALAGLAAFGLRELMERTQPARRALSLVLRAAPWVVGALLLFALPLGYFAVLTSQDKDAAIFARASAAANGLVFFAGLLIAGLLLLYAAQRDWLRPAALGALAAGLIFLDVASLGSNVDVAAQDPTGGFDHPGIVSFLKSDGSLYRIDARTGIWHLWQPDTPLLNDLYDVSGVVNPLMLADYDRFLNGIPDRSSRLYDFLNAKYVIAAKDVTLDWRKFVPVFDGDPALNVYLNRSALPRALVVHRAVSAPDHEAAWAAVQAPDFDPAAQVVLEGGEALDVSPAARATIHFDVAGLNRLQLRVDTPADGYLVLGDAWYPGWQAWVDGQPAPVLRANYAFRAVRLAPGQHRVQMTFVPRSWAVGLALTLLTLTGVVVWGGIRAVRTRRSRL